MLHSNQKDINSFFAENERVWDYAFSIFWHGNPHLVNDISFNLTKFEQLLINLTTSEKRRYSFTLNKTLQLFD